MAGWRREPELSHAAGALRARLMPRVRRLHSNMDFPDYSDAPASLLAADGHCGLLAAWTVLRYFGMRPSAAKLTKACGYTRRHGVFTIGLASALAEHGLAVEFYSQPDPRPKPIERRLYSRARRLGVAVRPATSLERLLSAIDRDHVPIVFYNTPDDVGHFSALLGSRRGRLLLPNTSTGSVSVDEFYRGWRQPGILRQAIICERPSNQRLERTGGDAAPYRRARSAAGRSAARYPYKRDEEVRQLTDLETVSA